MTIGPNSPFASNFQGSLLTGEYDASQAHNRAKPIQVTAGRFFSQLFTVIDAFKNKLGLASLSPFKMADLGGISAPPGVRGTNAGVMGNKGTGRSQ